MQKKDKHSCDILVNDIENTFENLGYFFDALADDKKTKMKVVESLFKVFGNFIKFVWHSIFFTIKYTPKAIVSIANVKHEIVDEILNSHNEYNRQFKENALNEKIKKLNN